MKTWRVSLIVALVGLGAWACKPPGEAGGLDDTCWKHQDCPDGQLCSPGALRCVNDVTVQEGELAGSFEFILAPPLDAGSQQKLYVKALLNSRTYELYDMVTFGITSDGSSLFSGLRGRFEGQEQIGFFLTMPQDAFDQDKVAPFGDGLAPYIEGLTATGRLEVDDAITGLTSRILGEVRSGQFRFTRIDKESDGAWAYGGTVAAEFMATIEPPTYYMSSALATDQCTEDELLDPNSLTCTAAFSGWNTLMGFDSVYNGFGDRSEGKGAVSYLGEDVVQKYAEVSGSSSFQYEDLIVLQAQWKAGGDECRTRSDCEEGCEQECEAPLFCEQGLCRNPALFDSCASDGDCPVGQYCDPLYLVCRDKIYCLYGNCQKAAEIVPCEDDSPCSSPTSCDKYFGMCLRREPRFIEIRTFDHLVSEGAELDADTQFSATVFDAEEMADGTIVPGNPIGGLLSGKMVIRHFREETGGRLFVSLWGNMELTP